MLKMKMAFQKTRDGVRCEVKALTADVNNLLKRHIILVKRDELSRL